MQGGVHGTCNGNIEDHSATFVTKKYVYTDRVFSDHMTAHSWLRENYATVLGSFEPRTNSMLQLQIQSIAQS